MEVKLRTKHIVMLSRLVSKMGIKLDMSEKDQSKLGINIIMDIVSSIHLAEVEFYELVASLTGYDSDVVKDMEIEELIDALNEVAKKVILFIQPRQESTTSK